MARAKRAAAAEMKAAAAKRVEEEKIIAAIPEIVIKIEKDTDIEHGEIAESQDAEAQKAEAEQSEFAESQDAETQEADVEQYEVVEPQDAEAQEANMEQDEVAESQDTDTQEANAEEDAHTSEIRAAGERNEKPPLTEEDHAFIAEVLKTKVKLSDDTESEMFSYGPPKFDGPDPTIRRIICHLCRITTLQRPDIIRTHMNGRRHLDNLKCKINAQKFLEPYLLFHKVDGDTVKQFKIFPGENISDVTAEYESRIIDQPGWEFKPIDNDKIVKSLTSDSLYEYNRSRPILGLDYLLKMKYRGEKKIYCVLCHMYTEPSVYQHVVDAKHQATYIIKHFPILYEKVVQNLTIADDIEKETVIRNIFRKLYRKLEIKHGFKKMHLVDSTDFFSSRLRYINKVQKMPHYDENTMEFTENEVDALISKSNKNLQFNKPDPPTLRIALLKRGAPVVAVQDAPVVKHSRYIDEAEIEKWSKYRGIMSKKLAKLVTQYKKYERDPELHPHYQDEWSEFWHARCVQLAKDNIDPDTYNFDKEWIPFWRKRLRQLYYKDLAERRTDMREKFGFPIGRRTPSPSNQSINERQYNQIRPIPVSDNFIPNMSNFVSNNSSNIGRVDGGWREQHQPMIRPGPATNRVTREPVSIISVLRLLTALEDQLGSLGPKAVELLGKAVLYEKNNQNMNNLLMDNDYYVLFATSKEKLKGQIMMNVIDNSKILAINTVIEDLSTILGMVKESNRSIGRSNTEFDGNTIGDDGNFRRGGRENFRNNDNGNFGNNSGRTNRANDAVNNRGSNDGGNYRNASSDVRIYRDGSFIYDDVNYRSNSNHRGNYHGSDDSWKYRDNSNDGGKYRGTNNDGRRYRGMNTHSDDEDYRGGNNNDGGNYRRSNKDGRINRDDNNGSDNYRSPKYRSSDIRSSRNNDRSNHYTSSNNTASNYRKNDGGNNHSSSLFGGDFGHSDDRQYRISNVDNLNTQSSSFGGGNSSNHRGNWMGSGGSIYTSSKHKSNTNAPAFGSGSGGGSNRPQPLMSFGRNTSSNYGLGSVVTRRFN